MRITGLLFVIATGLSLGLALPSPLMAQGGPANIAEPQIVSRLVGDARAAQFFRQCERFERVVRELANIRVSVATAGLVGGASLWMQREAAARARELRAEGCPPRTAGVTPAAAPQMTVNLSGGISQARVSQVQGGTQFDPVSGTEIPIATSDKSLTGGSANFSIDIPTPNTFVGDSFYFNIGGSWFHGNANGFVPVGATNVAQTYIVPNPVSGSTGIAAGATGQTVRIDSDGRVLDISFGVKNQLRFFGFPHLVEVSGRRIELHQTVGFRYRHLHVSHTTDQQSGSFPDLNSRIDLRQDSNFFGANFGIGVSTLPPVSQPGFVGGIQVFVAPGVLSTSANATQLSHCGPCGIASPEFNVSLRRELSSSDFSVIAGGSAKIGYRLSSNMEFALFGTVEHMTRVPFFNVPTTPAQQPISLGGGSTTNLGVRANLAMFSDWHN